jgi:hypothetical protein
VKVGLTTETLEEASTSSCANATPAKSAEAHTAGAIAELNRIVRGTVLKKNETTDNKGDVSVKKKRRKLEK